jgi:hypothetical protein
LIDWKKEKRMSWLRPHALAVVTAPVLILCLGLLTGCGGGVGTSHVIIPEGCVATQADLQGTWVISHVVQTLTCPAGSTLQTTAAPNSITPVTVIRDESLPGFRITATGLTATVEDITCHIVWTYLDRDTNALFDCYTTFHPETRTAGGTVEAGHCSQVTLVNQDGTSGESCVIPSPYLDSYIVVEGS